LTAGCGGQQHETQTIAVSVSPQSATVGSGQTIQFTATVMNDSSGVTWSVSGTAGGTIDASGNFTGPAVTTNATATIIATSKADSAKTGTASVTVVAPGVVTATANVQVANYTITPPSGATVSIEFGPDTNYGLSTWQQPATSTGGPVSIFVAGMRLNSTYHMRAVIKLADSTEFDDVDHTFITGTIPANGLPNLTLQNGEDPQDWFYAQHDANIISANSSEVFDLLLFDDGNQRVLNPSGTICGVTPCESRVPIFHLDETAKTAAITWVDKLAPSFSFFGGSARQLQNGNIEYHVCGFTVPLTSTPANASDI
jgi:hypothetical protein